jgi:hypothetical protein
MKIEITRQGVYDKDGKEIEIGTEIEVKGKDVPAWLVNKGKIVAEKPAKATPVTNPAKPSAPAKTAAPAQGK